MSWSQEALRKYSNTGHFRLLKQLSIELKAKPIIRHHPTRKANKVDKNNQLKDLKELNTLVSKKEIENTEENKAKHKNAKIEFNNVVNSSNIQPSQHNKFNGYAKDNAGIIDIDYKESNKENNDQSQSLQKKEDNDDAYQWKKSVKQTPDEQKKSFKERLDDIDMR